MRHISEFVTYPGLDLYSILDLDGPIILYYIQMIMNQSDGRDWQILGVQISQVM